MSEKYPTHYSSTALTSFWASLVSIVFALCFERDFSQWRLGWNIRLLTVAYAVIYILPLHQFLTMIIQFVFVNQFSS
jgi:hypothetical protein